MSAICVMRRKVGMLAKLREHKPSSVLPAIKEYFTRIGSLDTAWLHWKIYQHNKWYIDAIVDTYDMLIQYSIYIYIYWLDTVFIKNSDADWTRLSSIYRSPLFSGSRMSVMLCKRSLQRKLYRFPLDHFHCIHNSLFRDWAAVLFSCTRLSQIDRLIKENHNSSTLAMELRFFFSR